MVSQQQIDACGYAGDEVINVDPIGGGVDVVYSVDILSEIRSNPYSKRMIQWKASNSVPDAIPGESANIPDDVHFVGVPRANDERIAFVECTQSGDFTLEIPSFSEVSDEIVVRRVFCAALRPTDAGFTFANPIKDITVSASSDTVNLQVIALDEYKTVTATNSITVTHAQDFPCVFGIIYKHKVKGENTEPVPAPVIEPPILRHTFSFSAPNEVNYIERTFDAGGSFFSRVGIVVRLGGIGIEGITLTTREANKKCLRLRISEFYKTHSIVHDIVGEEDNLTIGDNETLSSLVTAAGVTRLNATSVIEMTLPMMQHDCTLTISYKQIDA